MNNALEIMTNLKSEIWFKILASSLVAALTALATLMANRRVAVFNDAARPLVGEAKKGNLDNKTLALSSFGLSVGFVIGFIPTAAAQGIIIIHIILLMSDIMGLSLPQKKWAIFVSLLLGLIWGFGIYWGLEGLQWLFTNIAYPNFGFELGRMGDVYNALFPIFPAVVIGYQFGWFHGIWSAVVIMITFLMVTMFGASVKLNALAISLLIGMVLMFGIAIVKNIITKKQQKITQTADAELVKKENQEKNYAPLNFFRDNAEIIKANKWWFLASGILVPLAAAGFALQQPQTISMWATGDMTSVLITESVKTFSFIPLVAITALATGVYSPGGLTLSNLSGAIGAVIGFSIASATNNPSLYLVGMAVGGVLGGALQFGEVYCLLGIALFLDRNPLIRSMGDGIRTAISQILNLSLLVGGVIASFVIGTSVSAQTGISGLQNVGMLMVLGAYLLNKTFKKPIPEIAIGPMMTIVFGIVANIIYFAA